MPGTWHIGPRWSPDGKRILFVSSPKPHRGWFHFLVDADGRRLRRIPRFSLTPDNNADWAWSRDGRRIFVLTFNELFEVRRDSGEARELADGLKVLRFSVSPDGRRLAVMASIRNRPWEIFVMNADGTGLRQLTDNQAHDGNPRWSPDGRRIAFESARDGDLEIYVMSADGTDETNISRNPGLDERPTWMPTRP